MLPKVAVNSDELQSMYAHNDVIIIAFYESQKLSNDVLLSVCCFDYFSSRVLVLVVASARLQFSLLGFPIWALVEVGTKTISSRTAEPLPTRSQKL